jgi:choice-of-anchor B domain-containing protein
MLIVWAIAVALPQFVAAEDKNLQEIMSNRSARQTSSERLSAAEQPYILDSIETFTFGTYNGSDVWGWIGGDGRQYAIMGTDFGVVFVDVDNLTPVDTVPGSSCLWQDMKTYGDVCYAVSECGSGLRVIDMQYLPDSAHLVGIFQVSPTGSMSSHNIFVDSVKGFLYVEGDGYYGLNVYIYDLSDPRNPVFVSSFGARNDGSGLHDFYCMNDTCYTADGYIPLYTGWDMTDKQNPSAFLQIAVPDACYCHNIWPSDDRKHLITT